MLHDPVIKTKEQHARPLSDKSLAEAMAASGLLAASTATKWYVVVSKQQREQEVASNLRRRLVRAYWPNYELLAPSPHLENGNKVRRMMRVGVLPGYIFTPGPSTGGLVELIGEIASAINVVRSFSGDLLALAQEDIDLIHKIEAGLNTPVPTNPAHNFKMGEKVRFADDLASRWPPGKISRIADDGRISVLAELMGRKVPVTVFPHQIERM